MKPDKPVMRVDFHDVPQNRFPADFHHGLRTVLGFLGYTGAVPTRKNNYFHLLNLQGNTICAADSDQPTATNGSFMSPAITWQASASLKRLSTAR